MAKITFSHQITERRNFGAETVNQEMVITINYDPKEDHIQDVHAVDIYQDGVKVAEISKLLDKAEGQPLLAMIEAIEWRELYYDQKAEDVPEEDERDPSPMTTFANSMLSSFAHLQNPRI